MHFLKPPRKSFIYFALFGLLDAASTVWLIARAGIEVEANPLIRYGFQHMSFMVFLPHLAGVLLAAYLLSQPSWSERPRLHVKTALFYVYIFVLVNNWYQVIFPGVTLGG